MFKYPKIKLKIDIERDIRNCFNFVRSKRGDKDQQFLLWFLPDDFQYILSKNFSEKERSKIIKEYTNHIYKIKRNEIKKGLEAVKKNWQKVESRYFKLINKVFKGHPWPQGNYRGIISVWRMFPRYIKPKIFFFPYRHKVPKFSNKVIAHELLHFIFFDYIDKKYGLKEMSEKGKLNEYVWQVSEVFNDVMEDWQPYYSIFKIKPMSYPDTEKIFAKMKKQWEQKQDIDWLLDQWFKDS